MTRSTRSFLLVTAFLLACGTLGVLSAQRLNPEPSDVAESSLHDNLKQFSQIYDIVEQNNADPVSADKALYQGAIPGMLHVLDPHSNFFDPKSFGLMREEQRGKYYGVGMTVGPRNNKVIVIAPFVGTPAYRAGIRPGDIISAVDGKSADNMTTSDVADLLKGAKGTPVKITILREGSDKPIDFVIIRDEIPRYSVDIHFLIRPGIGYMHVSSFGETTEQEVQTALDSFGDMKGLILDLRGNPGGLLDAAVGVADKFLHKGQVVVSHHGRSSPDRRYYATHGNGGNDYPIVCLVNRGSASAAEILSGALQDHDRGLIIGETTFGKGLVQTVYRLSEKTGLALTTARYYTPSGRLIQRDYTNVSLYDYYTQRDNEDNKNDREVKLTDSGRTVYGGGGINPDVKIEPTKSTHFQEALLQHYSIFNFAKHYSLNHHITNTFEADDSVMQEFRKFMDTDSEKVPYTEAEMLENNDWLRQQIRAEVITDAFGQDEGLQVRAETDSQIQKAIELLPKAQDLSDSARKVVAERISHPPVQR